MSTPMDSFVYLAAAQPETYVSGGGKGAARKGNTLTAEQQAAYDTILNGIDGASTDQNRFGKLQNLYQQEEDLYKQGRAVTTDRDLRDQYRDAWKRLNVDKEYTNPYMTGDWGGYSDEVSQMADRAENWKSEMAKYQVSPHQTSVAVSTAYRTPAGTRNIINLALKGSNARSVTASPTRNTYSGDIA